MVAEFQPVRVYVAISVAQGVRHVLTPIIQREV
jgi:hypothetical protein